MKKSAASLVLVLLLAACGGGASRTFQATFPARPDIGALPVALHDMTTLVTAIEPAPESVLGRGLWEALPDPSEPKAMYVTWMGGNCITGIDVGFDRETTGFGLRVFEHQGFGSCAGVGISRGLRILSSTPIDVDSISFYDGGRKVVQSPDEDCGPLGEAQTGDAKTACLDFLVATIEGREGQFRSVSVEPDGPACPATDCATASGIEARAWRVTAIARDGRRFEWHCTYRAGKAACEATVSPSGS